MRVLTLQDMSIHPSATALEGLAEQTRSLNLQQPITEFLPLSIERPVAGL